MLLDVRRHDEFDSGGVRGALHVPLQELEVRLDELPGGEIWVYCRSGFRAGIAASILQRAGHPVVHIDDDLVRVAELELAAPRLASPPEARTGHPGRRGAAHSGLTVLTRQET